MASSSNISKTDDQQQHYADKEAARKNQNGEEEVESWSSSKQMKYKAFVVLGIIVVLGAAMGTIWAVVKPKSPVYFIEYAHIENTEPFSFSSTSLRGNCSYVMRSENPNEKATIYYKSMKVYNSFSQNDTSTSVSHLEDFSQPPFNVTRIRFSFRHEFLSNDYIFGDLRHCKITVNISVKVEMRFEFGHWKSNPRTIRIFCQPATVMLGQNFEPTDCNINL